jgi:hypothetical protein
VSISEKKHVFFFPVWQNYGYGKKKDALLPESICFPENEKGEKDYEL